jgi:UDP-N-acetylglucosamine--dolichyl-phosphate N-acetylglucosaminephosphotransferase
MRLLGIHFSDLWASAVIGLAGFVLTRLLIPRMSKMFIDKNLFGIDLCKISKAKIAESQGVIAATVFLFVMFCFTFVPFQEHLTERGTIAFPFNKYVEFIAALLSICCMTLLGFADDVLDLKWRYKLLWPTIASLPLLMVYSVSFDLTTIIVPAPARFLFGYSIDIGVLYYVYMGMLAVFCTNAININAGINGIEAGQSLVIAGSVVIFNFLECKGEYGEAHEFSLYFMLPFIGVCLALLSFNWYPAQVFVGDTFCYFAGMSFAVVAILGHFSKTMLLFFIPQVFNFLFSVPQLFHLVPCPRHRLPRHNAETDKLEMSYSQFKTSQLSLAGRLVLTLFRTFRLVDVRQNVGEGSEFTECSNMTIINLVIHIVGPTHERTLTVYLLVLQIVCSLIALFIRYPLARLMYDT